MSSVARRHTALQLCADSDLVVGSSDVRGDLIEIQVEWVPLGWVVEDWIKTIAVAPSEHAALSEADVDGTSRFVGDLSAESDAWSEVGESSSRSTHEVMRLATNVLTSGRGVNAGFSARPGPASVDPVASLAQAVTGTLQLGYSSATVEENGSYGANVQQELGAAIQRVATELRSSRSRSRSDSVGRLLDRRTLRVVRNPSTAHTLNLAVFSLARKWRVRTCKVRRARVVFVSVAAVSEPFTVDEVFRYRPVLAGVLLDRGLCRALNDVAGRARSAPTALAPRLERIEVRVAFSDAPTRGSHVSMTVQACRSGGPPRRLDAELPSVVRPGRVYAFDLSTLDHEEDDLIAVELAMHAGGSGIDRKAVVGYLRLSAVRSDGTRRTLVERDWGLELYVGEPRALPLRGVHAATPDPDADVDRLLDHLNAFRHYYRLAVDLQRDSVSRFVALEERVPPLPIRPLDMNPVGVAGAHIAFLCADDKPGRHIEPDPTELEITTPSDGVLVEAVPGSGSADVNPAVWRASELPTSDGAFVWPPPFSPFGPEAATPGGADADAGSPTGPAAAAPPDPGLPVAAADLNGLAEALASKLADLMTGAKDAAGTSRSNGTEPSGTKDPGPA
ncbi:MAG: hypothetical protein M3235_08935 [Actinomycetota bacterium]|nr:hypothetical protein [Actinomycetota bacterium]